MKRVIYYPDSPDALMRFLSLGELIGMTDEIRQDFPDVKPEQILLRPAENRGGMAFEVVVRNGELVPVE